MCLCVCVCMYIKVVACRWGISSGNWGEGSLQQNCPSPKKAHVRRFVLPTLKKRNTHLLTPPTHKHTHVYWVSDGGVKAPLVSNKSKSGLLWVQYLTFLEAFYNHNGTEMSAMLMFPSCFLTSNIYLFVLSRYVGPGQPSPGFPLCPGTASATSARPQAPPALQTQWILSPQPLP